MRVPAEAAPARCVSSTQVVGAGAKPGSSSRGRERRGGAETLPSSQAAAQATTVEVSFFAALAGRDHDRLAAAGGAAVHPTGSLGGRGARRHRRRGGEWDEAFGHGRDATSARPRAHRANARFRGRRTPYLHVGRPETLELACAVVCRGPAAGLRGRRNQRRGRLTRQARGRARPGRGQAQGCSDKLRARPRPDEEATDQQNHWMECGASVVPIIRVKKLRLRRVSPMHLAPPCTCPGFRYRRDCRHING